MNSSTPGLPVHHQLPEFTPTHVHRVGDAIQPSYPLSSPSPAFRLSQQQDFFQWVSSSHEVPKVLEFQFQHWSSNEHPGLISFRMGWLDHLAVQRTLKSILQHRSSKASILRCSAFFTVQLSHPYMTTGKTIALTRRTFVGKVMFLLLRVGLFPDQLQATAFFPCDCASVFNGVLYILMTMETENKTDCYGLLPSGYETLNENGYSSITTLFFFALATSVLPVGDIMRYFVKCLQKTRCFFFFLQ